MISVLQNLYQRFTARRMFAAWSPTYEQDVEANRYSAADKVAESALKHLASDDVKILKIADIGIGTGLLAQQIYDAVPCEITGIDFAEDMMAQCLQRDITELLIKCDAGRDHWPLTSGSQDAVVSAGLVEYFTPSMLQHFLQQSQNCLKENGWLVFTYVPAESRNYEGSLWHGKTGSVLTCRYTPQHMESLLTARGLSVKEHGENFAGSVFRDGSTYPYRLIAAQKTT